MKCLDLDHICQNSVRWQDKDIDKGKGNKGIGMWSGGVAPTDKWYWYRTRNTVMQGHKTIDKIKVKWQAKGNKRKMRDMGYGWCRTRHNKPCWIKWQPDIHLIKDLAGVSSTKVSPLRSLYSCLSGSERWGRYMDTEPGTLKLLFSRGVPGGKGDMTLNEMRQSKVKNKTKWQDDDKMREKEARWGGTNVGDLGKVHQRQRGK